MELYGVEVFLKGLGNKRISLAVLDKAPDSIVRAVEYLSKCELGGGVSIAMIVEVRTEEGQVFRLEGRNKGGPVNVFLWRSMTHSMVVSWECMV